MAGAILPRIGPVRSHWTSTGMITVPERMAANFEVEPRGSHLRTVDNAILIGLLLALSASFYYGWFHDGSHAVGGVGWYDQTAYSDTARYLADFHWPLAEMLHYAPGYSLLAAPSAWLWRDDPFWLTSYTLLIGSAALCYRAARTMLGPVLSSLFLVSMFAWDGHARSFAYISELFAVPWNNQVVFFAFAFFFWLLTTRRDRPLTMPLLMAIGAVGGLLATTREEGVLFCLPLAIAFLVYKHASLRAWLTTVGTAIVVALPGLAIKQHALGNIFSAGPGRREQSYSGTAHSYFSPANFARNVRDVVVDADFAKVSARRDALFESSPWLWLGLVGIIIVFVSRRYHLLTKLWVAMSLLLIAFYLSGGNVSAAKLKVHCIRYITPGLIAVHFGVAVAIAEGIRLVRKGRALPPPTSVDLARDDSGDELVGVRSDA
jgi:hypothetical protein